MDGASIVPAHPPDDLAQCIDKLHAADNGIYIKQLLLQLDISQPVIEASLRAAEATSVQQSRLRQKQSQQVQDKPVSLSNYVWGLASILNVEHEGSSEFKNYDREGCAFRSLLSMIDSIEEKAIATKAHWRTKYSALDALCEIGNVVVGSKSDLTPGIRKRFQGDWSLEDVVDDMVAELTEDVRYKILYEPDADGELLAVRFQQLLLNGRHHGIFNHRDNLTQLFRRDSREDESEREENDSDEDECDWAMARRRRTYVP